MAEDVAVARRFERPLCFVSRLPSRIGMMDRNGSEGLIGDQQLSGNQSSSVVFELATFGAGGSTVEASRDRVHQDSFGPCVQCGLMGAGCPCIPCLTDVNSDVVHGASMRVKIGTQTVFDFSLESW